MPSLKALRIEALTPEQEASIPKWRDEWLRIGMAAGPCDQILARDAINRAYRAIGKGPPVIVWCDSPLTCQIGIAAIRGASLRDSLWDSLGASLRASLGDSLGASLGDSLRDSLRASLGDTYFLGQHDSFWVCFYKFCEHLGVRYEPEMSTRLCIMADLCRSCGWVYFFENMCFVSARPEVHTEVDDRSINRLHCETGPAMKFNDGWNIWAWHGVRVPQDVIERPETITEDAIFAEPNAEVRRVMIERYGKGKLLSSKRLKLIDQNAAHLAELYTLDLGGNVGWGLLSVTCHTTGKTTVLWANPQHRTARAALAASWGMTEQEYAPAVET
jgi:hypothetical protein